MLAQQQGQEPVARARLAPWAPEFAQAAEIGAYEQTTEIAAWTFAPGAVLQVLSGVAKGAAYPLSCPTRNTRTLQ